MKRSFALSILSLILSAILTFALATPEEVDLDLSIMPPSIAYSQAIAMLHEPADYVGQTVRISGVFNFSEARQRAVCIIANSTGCCETSLDFSCAEDLSFPGDYPDLYSRIVVVGRFESCADAEGTYCLVDAVIETA